MTKVKTITRVQDSHPGRNKSKQAKPVCNYANNYYGDQTCTRTADIK